MDLYIDKNVWWIVGKQTVVLTHLKPDFHWKGTLLNVLKALRFLAIFWGLQGNLSNSSTMSSKLIADVRLNWSNTSKVQIGSCFHTFLQGHQTFFCTRYNSTQAKFNLLNMSDGSDSVTPFSMSMSIYGDTCKTNA